VNRAYLQHITKCLYGAKMLQSKIAQESKILTLALSDKQIAVTVLGQALLDEGGIGSQSITIFYTNRGEAEQLWKIADSLGYANVFRRKKHRNHFHYGFSIKASKRKELYEKIGPLPNLVKDIVFRHLATRQMGKSVRCRGETRTLILESLAREPKTVLQLMLELNTSASTMRRHLKELNRRGLVKIVGKNTVAFQKSLRTAHLWGLI
jgi:DNA-binding transcriptional ArsR family regulator